MSDIEFRTEGHVAHVRLNRPSSLNAITPAMDAALRDAWLEINATPDVWVAVLSAEGERAFCAGADVSGESNGNRPRMALGGGLTGVGGPLLKLTKPLIAAVQGHVVGGGMELALCADIIVAADTTKFSMPETRVGIIGESGIMHRAIRQLPQRVAMAMILTGERMPAADALHHGLVNEVVAYDELADAAGRWAEKICAASPLAVQAAKDAVLGRLGYPLEVALQTRYEPIEAFAFSADQREGRSAFAEKRAPNWQGR
ncbi:MAG TPA: enoyl-CoA hydratase-related protein [Baekduia sp.]|nr:enoyl-CoA hydratase-related protein [Baekduia sp.]